MAEKVKPVPKGFHTLTPYLIVKGAAQALDFYRKAFRAKETVRMPGPDGQTVMHAEMKIGRSHFMLSEEFPDMGSRSPHSIGGTPVSILIYVKDVDAAFKRAVKAGAKAEMPPEDMFWGDRWSKVTDPFGHQWQIATHKEDLTPEEINRRGQEFFAKMGQQQQG